MIVGVGQNAVSDRHDARDVFLVSDCRRGALKIGDPASTMDVGGDGLRLNNVRVTRANVCRSAMASLSRERATIRS